ncbi:IclR family transcriptional regulator [Aquisalinus flavus]|uniref:Transcriptional regulator n=1 Tax=Aquisalinus flavus TaxID=1526572 RepID=A0A8J2Y6L6_9PROT|nr:IclR family transcriptional regulator [Aquisalinus flavus]MBD0425997.1 IclR family transcriptional regulator [Aquisalinus flavus]UNE48411.1 IclR family transcriptional regulator [Aquisalinus flavus]GGD11538.1 transcriptional regulator [Aquisalinus flavus]
MTESKGTQKPRYKAPALAKGLEILELLASAPRPFTLSGISERIERSRSEIFRMVQDLETLGYIRRSASDDGYEITNKLFTLGLEQPPVTTLLEAALPEMRRFVLIANQSCHLAIPFDGEIVVIARIEGTGPVNFAVRVGHRQAMHHSNSGIILYAHQPADVQKAWVKEMENLKPRLNRKSLAAKAEQARKQGYLARESNFIRGVTDLGAPIMRGGRAIASLTSPCVSRIDAGDDVGLPIELIIECAGAISREVSAASG